MLIAVATVCRGPTNSLLRNNLSDATTSALSGLSLLRVLGAFGTKTIFRSPDERAIPTISARGASNHLECHRLGPATPLTPPPSCIMPLGSDSPHHNTPSSPLPSSVLHLQPLLSVASHLAIGMG